jgi:hypothetical protein
MVAPLYAYHLPWIEGDSIPMMDHPGYFAGMLNEDWAWKQVVDGAEHRSCPLYLILWDTVSHCG